MSNKHQYKEILRPEFEKALNINCRNIYGFVSWREYTDFYIESPATAEYVYLIKTKNRAVDIIVYSSISREKDKTRACGQDAVRLVYKWSTKNGLLYKKIHKNYRTGNFFNNFEKCLKKAIEDTINLDTRGWKDKPEA